MSSLSLVHLPLSLPSTPNRRKKSHPPISILHRPIISASVSEKPSSSSPPPTTTTTNLPIRKIPGSYGPPLVGPLKDRLDFFYNQGREAFFKTRIQRHQSTVFRTNMPPGPFISPNPNVVALLDAVSFPTLFDVSKVEKKDLFVGTYMPSTELTGGYRILSYLDPDEPSHAKLKQLIFFLLKSSRDRVIPEFQISFSALFADLEAELSAKGKAGFNTPNDSASFSFLANSLYGVNPVDTELGKDGPTLIGKWVLFQLGPLLRLGLPKLLEELLLHTFPLPPFLVKKDYGRLYKFFYDSAGPVLDEAQKMGISRDEATHNLIFATCFNSFGGMKIFFPAIVKWIGRAGSKLHRQLAEEIRSAIRSNGGEVSMRAMEQMPLMKSVVYEAFRIEPPVQFQYGKAKRDLIVKSHDAAFEIKKGEMLFGFQPFATKDPRIFDRAEEFVPDRFVGEAGEKLLKHVIWSNGPETENPTVENKQCAGKDFVVLAARLLVVEIFRRYDSFEIEVGSTPLGTAVTLTSLKRASF
ncbi:allene oxide synthase 1, chloroplastic-like [Magnolia sinica]|uniref:allene oxide synthase 1, chloroplastic-like n=1 Tax=Magnolia sinica TaxID=86752 RepID=UPI0026581F74|nr:allene oxide synthase 1, chloroplastic-like [Magnolia sinica]